MEDRFFYNDKELASRLRMLRNLAEGDDCLNLVIGEKGSGKTTLIESLLESSGWDWRWCNIRFRSDEESKRIAAVGNLHGRKGILLNIGTPPTLIIDDAQEIDIEGLRYLLRHIFRADGKRKIRSVILFCDPPENGFAKALSECIPNQSAANTLYVKPLSQDQTTKYLQQFSHHLGLPEKKQFSPSQAKKIFDASRGLPGKIQEEARRILDAPPFWEKAVLIRKLFSASSALAPDIKRQSAIACRFDGIK